MRQDRVAAAVANMGDGDRWFQDTYPRKTGDVACLLTSLTWTSEEKQELASAIDVLFPERGTRNRGPFGINKIIRFNDDPDTSWPDVLSVLKYAVAGDG